MAKKPYRLTPARKAVLKRAQAISARKRRGKKRVSRKTAKRVAVAGGVAVAATGLYVADRKKNTMVVYHATSHHRAKQIHKHGYKTKHRKRAYGNHTGPGPMHEAGKVFISTREKSIRSYGPAITSSRIRKTKFAKYASQDVHPLSIEGEKFGFKSRNSRHYNMQVSDMKKAGVKLRYTKTARKNARRRIYMKYSNYET